VRILFSLKTYLTFQPLWGSTTKPLITSVNLPVPLQDLLPLQVYQRRKKITIDLESLSPHQSIASTEASELSIALRKGTCSFTQHPIYKVISFFHLSLTYFSFAIKLSYVSLKII